MKKTELTDIVHKAITSLGGKATLLQVSKYIWDKHEEELKHSGDLFYTWQYDIRWAAQELRNSGVMKTANICPKGIWELSDINKNA